MSINPYETPKADATDINVSDGVIRCGKNNVFIPAGQDLPARCVICNAKASYPKKPKQFYYSNKYSLVFFLLGTIAFVLMGILEWLLILIIITLLIEVSTRFTARFNVGLCKHHHRIKMKQKLLWVSVFFISLGVLYYCSSQRINSPFVFLSFLGILISTLMISVLNNKIKVVKMTVDGTILKGFKSAFLDDLPTKY